MVTGLASGGGSISTTALTLANGRAEPMLAVAQFPSRLEPGCAVIVLAPPGDSLHHWQMLAAYLLASGVGVVRVEAPYRGRGDGVGSTPESLQAFHDDAVDAVWQLRQLFAGSDLGVVAPCLGARAVFRAAARIRDAIQFLGALTAVVDLKAAFAATLPVEQEAFWRWMAGSDLEDEVLVALHPRLAIYRELRNGWEGRGTTCDDLRSAAPLPVFDVHVEDDPTADTATVHRMIGGATGRVVTVPGVLHDDSIVLQPAVLTAVAQSCLDGFGLPRAASKPDLELLRDSARAERQLRSLAFGAPPTTASSRTGWLHHRRWTLAPVAVGT